MTFLNRNCTKNHTDKTENPAFTISLSSLSDVTKIERYRQIVRKPPFRETEPVNYDRAAASREMPPITQVYLAWLEPPTNNDCQGTVS